jgi:predicted DNA-binding transcriptional regulator YafY
MRADRLIALLMLLQTRGRMTAGELALELEVSERTIYRDLTALSTAGIPVYTESGPGGGVRLVDHYRTNLTGLKEDEVRALFMLSIPAPLSELGVGQELKAALLKLAAALPGRQAEQDKVRQRIHLDSTSWFQPPGTSPHLHTLHRAVWDDRRLTLTYRHERGTQVTSVVEPYGLVAKTSVWYLVAWREPAVRVYRVSQIRDAQLRPEHFTRRPDFDLPQFWKDWCDDYECSRPNFVTRLRISPALQPYLSLAFGESAQQQTRQAAPDDHGWITLALNFEHFDAARERVLALGRAIEVLEPEALRLSVIDVARQIVDFYQEQPAKTSKITQK